MVEAVRRAPGAGGGGRPPRPQGALRGAAIGPWRSAGGSRQWPHGPRPPAGASSGGWGGRRGGPAQWKRCMQPPPPPPEHTHTPLTPSARHTNEPWLATTSVTFVSWRALASAPCSTTANDPAHTACVGGQGLGAMKR